MEQVWKIEGRAGETSALSRTKGLTFCSAFINKFHFIYATRRYVIIINWPRDIYLYISTAQVARQLIKFDTLQGELSRVVWRGGAMVSIGCVLG